MDYLGMLSFSCIILGGGMLIGVALYKARGWWLRREERKSLKAIRQLEDEHYAGLHEALLRHAKEMSRKVDRP